MRANLAIALVLTLAATARAQDEEGISLPVRAPSKPSISIYYGVGALAEAVTLRKDGSVTVVSTGTTQHRGGSFDGKLEPAETAKLQHIFDAVGTLPDPTEAESEVAEGGVTTTLELRDANDKARWLRVNDRYIRAHMAQLRSFLDLAGDVQERIDRPMYAMTYTPPKTGEARTSQPYSIAIGEDGTVEVKHQGKTIVGKLTPAQLQALLKAAVVVAESSPESTGADAEGALTLEFPGKDYKPRKIVVGAGHSSTNQGVKALQDLAHALRDHVSTGNDEEITPKTLGMAKMIDKLGQ